VDVLVNNAGLSRGLAPIADTPEWHWREMIEDPAVAPTLSKSQKKKLKEKQKKAEAQGGK
jgi:NAD(P)-dependent dehydrogenase (short-subunit alcohol dehydrogenase family)